MIRTTVDNAEARFRELIEAALRGEDDLITADDETDLAVRISKVSITDADETPRPRFGSARGKIWIADDFDESLLRVAALPIHDHREPYDRILAAQALVENVPLVSIDRTFDSYGVQRIW